MKYKKIGLDGHIIEVEIKTTNAQESTKDTGSVNVADNNILSDVEEANAQESKQNKKR